MVTEAHQYRARSRSPRRSTSTPEDDVIKFGPGGYDFGAPEALPEAAKLRVQELLDSGRLFRYQGQSDVAGAEKAVAEYMGVPFVMACNSGGCALFLSLKALGVKPGDKVLLNAWTLAPVPGAVTHANATPVFVDVDREALTIDIEDLEAKAKESGAKVLVLSYMRGQIPDMDKVMAVVKRCGLLVVEDCAHTLGAKWKLDGESEPRHLGTFGEIGCWSCQTNKSINCGEGGLISTSRQDIASFITIATGSYGHYALNGASGDNDHLREVYPTVPNMSMRMTTVAAALLTPQLKALPEKLDSWERHALYLRKVLGECPHVRIVKQEHFLRRKLINVWSSIQFEVVGFSDEMVDEVIKRLGEIGIPVAWFGGPLNGFTSTLRDWKFADPQGYQWNEKMERSMKALLDVPLYHTTKWSDSVIAKLADTLTGTINTVAAQHLEKENETGDTSN